MRDHVVARSRLRLSCLFCLVVLTSQAEAQKTTVRGIVSDSAGRPLRDVDVAIVAIRQLARTDEYGRFSLRKVPPGEVEISLRRLGYTPATLQLVVVGGPIDSLRVALVAQPDILDVIEVSAAERQKRQWIEDFHRRRAQGIGTFATRQEILTRNSFRPSDMFRTTPGVRIQRGRGLRFNYSTSIDARRDCPPMLWIDGQRAPGMDLDDLPLTDIEGIELYSGPSTTPTQFSQGLTSGLTCGTVVVWSRPPNSRSP